VRRLRSISVDRAARGLTVVGVSVALAWIGGRARSEAATCDPVGSVRFICGQAGPEDLAIVPGSKWVISSGFAAGGGIRLIDRRDRTTRVIFPSDSAKERFDRTKYGSCPGPIDRVERDKFRSHGLYLLSGGNRVHRLFVVHHGSRESIEVFEFDARPRAPALTWIGCSVAPDPIGLNSVVGLRDGGFIATNFSPRGTDPAGRGRMMAGENNGELWEWHPGGEWKKVPGSDAAGPNGLEISRDGKWLYVGGWGSQSVIRLSRGQTPVKRDAVPVGFRVDNVRWAPDGMLLAAGQGGSAPLQTAGGTSHVARVDPNSLTFTELVHYSNTDTFSVGTVAVQIGDELWMGAVRGDRIAIFPRQRDP
jgi:hypothetical protein